MREELKTSLNLRHSKHDHVFDDRFAFWHLIVFWDFWT